LRKRRHFIETPLQLQEQVLSPGTDIILNVVHRNGPVSKGRCSNIKKADNFILGCKSKSSFNPIIKSALTGSPD